MDIFSLLSEKPTQDKTELEIVDIISFLFPKESEEPEPTKPELETTLENAKELSSKLGFSTTEILLAQILINHENHNPNL